MKFLKYLVPLLLMAGPLQAVDLITSTVVITNAPLGNTNNLVVAGSTRTFTNTPSSAPAVLIQQTNSIPWTATNILDHFTDYPVSAGHVLSGGTNFFRVRGRVGEALAITLAGGWGYVTNSTQTVSSPTFAVRVPITVEAASNQTSIASLLVKGISDSSTNAFATNSTAGSNFLTKGASPAQTLISPVQFFGRTAVNSNFFATNGYTKSLTNIDMVSSNSVNYGNAIRSEGSGGNSLQVGSNALANGSLSTAIGNSSLAASTRSIAIGNGATATNTDSMAIGTGATASTNSTVAIGNLTQATGHGAVAIGISSTAVLESVAVGGEAIASGLYGIAIGTGSSSGSDNAVALGYAASAPYSNSVAVGASAATTTTNQIRLGTTAETVSIPGVLAISGTATNTTLRGTNIVNGRVDFTSRANTSLANGNNAAVVLGTNVYVRLSGPSAGYTINGLASEQDGSWHIAEFANPVNSLTIADNSGTDPVAANRIRTGTGGDVVFTNNPVVLQFIYNATDARWKIANWFR